MNEYPKIKTFKDLEAWKSSHKLVLMTYRLTQKFPKTEQFGLTNQMRRASVSIASNLAEGFGRKTKKDKEHFYSMSLGSLRELEAQITIALDLEYITKEEFDIFDNLSVFISKLISGLQKSTMDRKY